MSVIECVIPTIRAVSHVTPDTHQKPGRNPDPSQHLTLMPHSPAGYCLNSYRPDHTVCGTCLFSKRERKEGGKIHEERKLPSDFWNHQQDAADNVQDNVFMFLAQLGAASMICPGRIQGKCAGGHLSVLVVMMLCPILEHVDLSSHVGACI